MKIENFHLSALQKHYQQKIEKKVRQAALRFVLILWATALIVNFVALGIIFWLANRGLWRAVGEAFDEPLAPIISPVSPEILVQKPEEGCDKVCSPGCRQFFEAALATIAGQRKEELLQVNPSVARSSTTKTIKEYYIPLGSITAKSYGQWSETGMQAYVDPANYGSNIQVFFEASMRIPTANGKVFLRLIQANENVVIFGSEIVAETDKARMVSSSPIALWSGNKLYKVQIKTSMDYKAVVDFARLKIIR